MAKLTKDMLGGRHLTNVLIEKQDINLQIPDRVDVLLNHDRTKPIGTAFIRRWLDGLEATLSLHTAEALETLTPAIGYKVTSETHNSKGSYTLPTGVITHVSLSTHPNVDPRILSIGEQLKQA